MTSNPGVTMDLAHRSDEGDIGRCRTHHGQLDGGFNTHRLRAAHTRDFTERARSALSKSALESICKHYQSTKGLFAEREFVAAFRRPESVAIVWRQTFTEAPGELVAELVLVQRGDKYLVDHVMVF